MTADPQATLYENCAKIFAPKILYNRGCNFAKVFLLYCQRIGAVGKKLRTNVNDTTITEVTTTYLSNGIGRSSTLITTVKQAAGVEKGRHKAVSGDGSSPVVNVVLAFDLDHATDRESPSMVK